MRHSLRFFCLALALLVVSGCGSVDVVEETTATTAASVASEESPTTTTTEAEPTATAAASPSTTRPPRAPLVDGPLAPSVTLELDDLSTLRLAEAYEPVVVFFWATWCHNCHEMMPAIDQMSADHDGRATVVAVARLSALHDVESDVIEYLPSGATRWALDDDSSISEAFRVPGNPVSILVVGGVEVDRWLGMASVADIEARLDEMLDLYE